MQINEKFGKLADKAALERAKAALEQNGMRAFIVENGREAKNKVLEIIPEGAEIMVMSSVTLDVTGVKAALEEGERFKEIKKILGQMDDTTQGAEKRRLAAAPEWAVGSIHAVTEEGRVLIASATGSQLPAYVFGARNVVWVVGTQKIVKNLDEGMRRIYEYTFPLEDERALKAYGMHSSVNKVLIVNKEFAPGRITIVLVKEKLGF